MQRKYEEEIMTDEVLVERREDRIAVLTLNRPEAMNAINRAMTRALREAIADVEADDAIDVMVLTGAGERAFSTGVDLKERKILTDAETSAFRARELYPMFHELDGRSKPAIAAVFGHTLAGGFELTLACDLIVAANGTSFGLPEVRWGLIPAAGGCRKLPTLIGAARAKEVILTAQTISVDEMFRLGAINRLVPREEVLPTALSIAQTIAGNKQTAVRGAKRAIDAGIDAPAGCRFDMEIVNACYASDERRSGIASFAAS
jgi:enoyl-CoA hydratase/carnithine racemase